MKNFVTINGREYEIPEMDFDTICELEENGVSLLAIDEKNPKVATMLRAFVAWIMHTDTKHAGAEISAHIRNGGNLMDLITAITDALNAAGFSGGNQSGSNVQEFPDQKKNKSQSRNTNP